MRKLAKKIIGKIATWLEGISYQGASQALKNMPEDTLKPKFELAVESNQMDKLSANMMRHLLSSINLDDARINKPVAGNELREHNARISALYAGSVEISLKKLIVAQEEYGIRMANNANLMFARGTLNGIMLIDEMFKDAIREHEASRKDTEPEDKHSMFSET